MANIQQLNSLSISDAHSALIRCCGSTEWVRRMVMRRPFADEAKLCTAATEIWRGLARGDWLEAFRAHPRIGSLDALHSKFSHIARWSFEEQAGVAGAPDSIFKALVLGNRRYEAKFGFIFIVCATGKSAGEMLAILNERLQNEPEQELAVAAAEQEKITLLRLGKL